MKYTPFETTLPVIGHRSGNFTLNAVSGGHGNCRSEFIRDNGG
jgi:hypothetical protein